jgi:hypothetical protein
MRRIALVLALAAVVSCGPTTKRLTGEPPATVTIGNRAPMLAVTETYNLEGALDLADYAGKVVVLDFWTYW